MVRFKVNYGAHISRNLRYMDYDKLKNILHEDEEKKSLLPAILHPTSNQQNYHALEFTNVFLAELDKVDNCYMQHMVDLDYAFVDTQRLAKEYKESKGVEKWKRKAQEAAIKRNTTTLYDKLSKLETYRLLNRTAAIKILKKHDKMTKESKEEPILESYMAKVDQTNFGDGSKLNGMKSQIETMYADVFCNGILEEAKGKLTLAKTHTDPQILLGVAFKVGIVVTLIIWLINNLIVSPRLSLLYLTYSDPSVNAYAAVGALVIYRWFWGFSVYMWDSADIDYILILDLDANKHMPSSDQIFSDAGNLSILYLLNVLLFHSLRYYYHEHKENHPNFGSSDGMIAYFSERSYIMPILLVVGTILRIIYSLWLPSSYGVFSSRIFKKLIQTPFTAVQLRHTFAADILASFTKVFSSMLFATCYFASGSYLYASDPDSPTGEDRFHVCNSNWLTAIKVGIYLYPSYIRCLQCLRQRRDYFVRHQQQKLVKLSVLNNKVVPYTTSSEENNNNNNNNITGTSSSDSIRKDGGGGGGVDLEKGEAKGCTTATSNGQKKELKLRRISNSNSGSNTAATCGNGNTNGNNTAATGITTTPHTVSSDNLYSHDRNNTSSNHINDTTTSHKNKNQDEVLPFGGLLDSSVEGMDAVRIKPNSSGRSHRSNSSELKQNSPLINDEQNEYDEDDFIIPVNEDDDNEHEERQDDPVPNIPNRSGKRPGPLSRSESFDYPLPTLLRWSLPSIHGYLPNMIIKFMKTMWVWPYSYNALRYFLSMCVIYFGAYPPQNPSSIEYQLWYIPLSIISTLYSCYWDVACDFKLMQFSSTKPLLRDKILYEEKEYFYYIVLILNPILRFFWTLSFTPYGHHPFLVLFEIMRRSMWACLRMELGYLQELERRK